MWHERLIAVVSIWWVVGVLGVPRQARGATFGDVVTISGQVSDIALDEARGVLYIANFTAGRIDVLSLAENTIRTSIHVAPAPSSLALSVDGRFLVITHFGNVPPPASSSNALTVIDLSSGSHQTYVLGNAPLGVAFGSDGMALVATTAEFLLLDPASGRTNLVDTIAAATANTLPTAPGTAPIQVIAASLGASADGGFIFGLADTIRFSYDVAAKRLKVIGYTATPALGPRVVSVARDASYYVAGWGLFNRQGALQAQFAGAAGLLAVGSHAIDSTAGIIYAQIPQAPVDPAAPAVLSIVDADNLAVRDRFGLAENLTGRAVLNAQANTLYAVSESGVMVLGVGSLNQFHRLAVDREDLVFHGSFCQRGPITQTFRLADPGGGQTTFALSSDVTGLTISPSIGRTPATIQVTIDPSVFQNQRGTVSGSLKIVSTEAVNLVLPVRILVSNQRPDERGSSTDVPGTLSDLMADPVRDRFYVIRQDRNQVLVFDGSGLFQIAALRTSNTPTRMAITFDRKNLLIGHDNSQLVYVYDLDTLEQLAPVVLPVGHYPRSIAVSGTAILVASRVVGGTGAIDKIDLLSRTGTTLPSLGVFQNVVSADTALVATPNGGAILAASADGNVLLYDAGADTFTVSRKLPAALTGSYAASNSGQFAAGNNLLSASLKPTQVWTGADFPSGFAFLDDQGLRLTGPQNAAGAGGTIQRFDLAASDRILPTRVTEQPLAAGGASVFTRTLAPLANRKALIALTVSGFTALSWNFDTPVAPPNIDHVVNAADLTVPVAPGSLIAVFGSNLSPINKATSEIPLPTAIGESCLTVNGTTIPMLFASPGQINAQLPLRIDGRATLTLYTPGGVSGDYFLNLLPAAPAIFQSGGSGPLTGTPVVIKAGNQQLVTPSNPIHSNDLIWIYATGLGTTSPEVPVGTPAPSTPPALTVAVPDVQLGGVPMAVDFSGLAPGLVGVYQIIAKAPEKSPTGTTVSLTIKQGGVATSVAVRVVD